MEPRQVHQGARHDQLVPLKLRFVVSEEESILMMLGYNLMQQNLLKTTSRSNAASNTQFKNGVLAS
jgi:hypothetical protein